MAKMKHFEIPTDDINRAQAFYREVPGFEYEPWGDDMGMLGEIQPLDESSRWVYLRDSEGNLIGLHDNIAAA